MKRLLLLSLMLPVLSITAYGQTCDNSLMAHVYRPERLVKVKGCVTVTGTVVGRRTQDDGDIHYQLKVDPGQGRGWMNQKNVSRQHGTLVFEPICVKRVKQDSAQDACRNFVQDILLPKKGDRVSITGIHVVDNEGGHGWREIHPVSQIKIIP